MSAQRPQANLADLQKRLNSDPELTNKFLKDPVATLKGEGVAVDPAMAKELKSLVQTSKGTRPADAALSRIGIRIIIKIGVAADRVD
jgi:hypothetical protein